MKDIVISSTVKTYPSTIPYTAIKRKILGTRYQLSLVFVGSTRATTLNQAYRQKSYTPNVLSFPITDTTGEMFICPAVAKREAPKFNLSTTGFIAYLFIHGCLHLKGYDHGATMDKLERKYCRAFNIS